MSPKGKETIELVTFKLNSGADVKDVLKANKEVNNWLENVPGFLYRVLSHDVAQQQWYDTVFWRSAEEAAAAAKAFATEPVTQALMMLIDPSTVTMHHSEVVMELAK